MTVRLIRKIGFSVAFIVGVAFVGFGIPLVWLLIAAEVQGVAGITSMSKLTAVTVFPGVILTYMLLMYLVGWALNRQQGSERIPPPRTRQPWLRSARDEPARIERPTGLEMVFILAASIVTAAFVVWFFLWAGPPV